MGIIQMIHATTPYLPGHGMVGLKADTKHIDSSFQFDLYMVNIFLIFNYVEH